MLTFAILKLGLKVPLKYFFGVTGTFLYIIAFIFAGNGIKELQAAGWVSTTPLVSAAGAAPGNLSDAWKLWRPKGSCSAPFWRLFFGWRKKESEPEWSLVRSLSPNKIDGTPSKLITALRCDCGSLLARVSRQGVEIKCRRCKRHVIVPRDAKGTVRIDV